MADKAVIRLISRVEFRSHLLHLIKIYFGVAHLQSIGCGVSSSVCQN